MIASRRSFLIGGVSVAAAAIPVAVPAVAALENPQLVSIGKALPSAMNEYRAALASYRAAVEAFNRIKPEIPQALICGWPDETGLRYYAARALDLDENEIFAPGSSECLQVLSAKQMREDLAEYSPRSKLGKKLRHHLEIAERYEADYQQALEASGAEPARDARKVAARAVELMADTAGKTEAKTMHGIVVKAQAFKALGEVEGYTQFNRATFCYGEQLLSEINSIMGAV
jgi:hypothetical protein